MFVCSGFREKKKTKNKNKLFLCDSWLGHRPRSDMWTVSHSALNPCCENNQDWTNNNEIMSHDAVPGARSPPGSLNIFIPEVQNIRRISKWNSWHTFGKLSCFYLFPAATLRKLLLFKYPYQKNHSWVKFGHHHCPLNLSTEHKKEETKLLHIEQCVWVCVSGHSRRCCSQGFLGYKQHDGCLRGWAECVGWTHYKLMADALA